MQKNTKQTILVLVLLNAVLLLLMWLGVLSANVGSRIMTCSLLLIIMPPVWNAIDRIPAKVDRMASPYQTVEEVTARLQGSIQAEGYLPEAPVQQDAGMRIDAWSRTELNGVQGVLFFQMPAVTQECKEQVQQFLERFVQEHQRGKDPLHSQVDLLVFFCADRMTPELEELLRRSQSRKTPFIHIPAAVCLEEKLVCIPRQKDGFGGKRFKKMRKQVYAILGVELP